MRRRLANLGVLAASLLIVLLLLEGGLRLFGLATPLLYRFDPSFGYEPEPSQTHSRLGVPVRINDIGLRDDEDLAALMQSTDRILVVGNSVAYGSSLVSQEELFTEVLEREMQGRRPGIKVLNAGVINYSVTQMVRRARRLVELTAPRYLVLYVIREDFSRPPVQYPADASVQQPRRRPYSALGSFAYLSLSYLDRRYGIRRRLPVLDPIWPKPPPAIVPPYDRSRIVDLHFEAVEKFLQTVWEPSGRDRSNVVAFLSPTRTEVAENRPMPNRDLVRSFESLGIRAHDLQGDFRDGMNGGGGDLRVYYHDEVHYLAKANQVAGRAVGKYLADHVLDPR